MNVLIRNTETKNGKIGTETNNKKEFTKSHHQIYIKEKEMEIKRIKRKKLAATNNNFNLNKNNYIINVIYKEINNIIEQTNQIKDNKKEKDFKEIMKSIFKNFCQKSIPINILKEFELLIINYFFSVHKIRLIPNFHYIYNNFFDCYNFIVYYIYDGQYKEKEFSQRKSSIIDNNLKILDSIKNISPKQFKTKNKIYNIKKTNKQFINFFFSNDLP